MKSPLLLILHQPSWSPLIHRNWDVWTGKCPSNTATSDRGEWLMCPFVSQSERHRCLMPAQSHCSHTESHSTPLPALQQLAQWCHLRLSAATVVNHRLHRQLQWHWPLHHLQLRASGSFPCFPLTSPSVNMTQPNSKTSQYSLLFNFFAPTNANLKDTNEQRSAGNQTLIVCLCLWAFCQTHLHCRSRWKCPIWSLEFWFSCH